MQSTGGQFQIPLPTPSAVDVTIDASRVLSMHVPPEPLENLPAQMHEALSQPPGYPALRNCVVPGDRVCIVMDVDLLATDSFLNTILETLQTARVNLGDITLVFSSALTSLQSTQLRADFPDLNLVEHNNETASSEADEHSEPDQPQPDSPQTPFENDCAYLASSADGQRIYLSRHVIDADFVISCGLMTYHHASGYRTTSTMIFPELSDQPTTKKYQAWRMDELNPEDDRQWRQLATEVDWLIGTPFSIQAVAARQGGISHIFTGPNEQTYQLAQPQVDHDWRFPQTQRSDIVLALIDLPAQKCLWKHLSDALLSARRLVHRDGKIILVSNLNQPLTAELDLLRRYDNPTEAFHALRKYSSSPDTMSAMVIAEALEWATLYALTAVPSNLIEDLFITPLSDVAELQRLLDATAGESCIVLNAAQYTYAHIQ